jgi:hypothetical protein
MNWWRIAVLTGLSGAAFSLGVGIAVSEEIGANRGYPLVSSNQVANVQGNAPVGAGSQAVHKQTKSYFIEFRARAAQSYGHTFAVHGRVGQKITADQVVGLHPFTESPIPWMAGHIILVPSETGASDGDTEDQYIIARYRILLTEQEHRHLVAHMKQMQASSPLWHAVLYNCNAFVADIAKYMGLKTPSSTLLMPKDFITQLRELNTGPASRKDQFTAPGARQKPADATTTQKQAKSSREPKPSASAHEGQKAAADPAPPQQQASARRPPLVLQ